MTYEYDGDYTLVYYYYSCLFRHCKDKGFP